MRRKKRRFGIYIVVVLLLLVICTVSLASCYIMSSINKISNTANKVEEIPEINEEKLEISQADEDKDKFSKEIVNIALFGIDERALEYDGDWTRADSIMILTIDGKNKKIKLSSILRDTYVDVLEYGEVKKDKINHSFAYGAGEEYEVSNNALLAYHAGAVRTIETLNNNFKLDIKDYAIINFTSFRNIVDKLGGVEINLTDQEISTINSGQSDPVSLGAGVKLLNGEQALAYARNRKDGSDTDRSLRQRNVVAAVFDKMKAVSVLEIPGVIDSLLTAVKTSLGTSEILSVAMDVLVNKMPMVNTRFPVDGNWDSRLIDGVSYDVVLDESLNLRQISDFIYGDVLPVGNFTTTTAPQ